MAEIVADLLQSTGIRSDFGRIGGHCTAGKPPHGASDAGLITEMRYVSACHEETQLLLKVHTFKPALKNLSYYNSFLFHKQMQGEQR